MTSRCSSSCPLGTRIRRAMGSTADLNARGRTHVFVAKHATPAAAQCGEDGRPMATPKSARTAHSAAKHPQARRGRAHTPPSAGIASRRNPGCDRGRDCGVPRRTAHPPHAAGWLKRRTGRRRNRGRLPAGVTGHDGRCRGPAPDLSGLATDPVATIRLVGGACAVHLGYLLCLVVSLRAAGIDLNPAVAALAYFAGSAVADLAPTPGGLGAAEVALAGAVATLGVQTDRAVAGVLIYRLATYWLLSIAGYVSWMAIRHKGILTVRPATGASPQSSPDAGRSRWPAPRSSGVPVRHVQRLPGSQL